MTEEEINQLKEYEWDKFCRRYPLITGKNWLAKAWVIFNRQNTAYLLWENGFLQGLIANQKNKQNG